MTGRILVVGDVITDILVVPQGPVARGTDTAATIRQMPGGSGANQAVWLAAMGAEPLPLKELSLVGTGLTDAGMQHICKGFGKVPVLFRGE